MTDPSGGNPYNGLRARSAVLQSYISVADMPKIADPERIAP